MLCLNPRAQAELDGLRRDLASDLAERGLAAVAWAAQAGKIRRAGERFMFVAEEQIAPVSEKARRFVTVVTRTDGGGQYPYHQADRHDFSVLVAGTLLAAFTFLLGSAE